MQDHIKKRRIEQCRRQAKSIWATFIKDPTTANLHLVNIACYKLIIAVMDYRVDQ